MSLISTKTEIAEVASLLERGASSPEELAKIVIKKITDMREDREQWFLVYMLSPGVHGAEGPFPTKAAAIKGAAKMPILGIASAYAAVPANGPSFNRRREQEAMDRPTASKIDPEVKLDQQAFRNGWRGRAADRSQYLPQST